MKKSCGNCVNCEKVKPEGKPEFWACDTYGFYFTGVPVDCTPPNNDPCKFWTDNPKKKNEFEKYI